MSSIFIIKSSIFLLIFFIFSCQEKNISLSLNNDTEIKNIEQIDLIDFSFNGKNENNVIDSYTVQNTNYNFLDKNNKKLKINNYEGKFLNDSNLNIILNKTNIYSVNSKGDILEFNIENGKILNRYSVESSKDKKEPVSFSLVDNDFIIGFKSGEVIRVTKEGKLIWRYNQKKFLNTPIKHFDNNLIILYPENIVVLSVLDGKIIYEKNYKSNKIIQASGGKVVNYLNLLLFKLPSSSFHVLDTFLFSEHNSNLDNIEIINSLNNLNDEIHIYKNLFVYLDNGQIINTFDLQKNEFLLTNYILNNSISSILWNNTLINQKDNFIEIYNIKNGNLFTKINIEKKLDKKSKLIWASFINDNLHIFSNNGKLIIIDKQYEIVDIIDLKIKNINRIYSYQDKIFISTSKGITYIF